MPLLFSTFRNDPLCAYTSIQYTQNRYSSCRDRRYSKHSAFGAISYTGTSRYLRQYFSGIVRRYSDWRYKSIYRNIVFCNVRLRGISSTWCNTQMVASVRVAVESRKGKYQRRALLEERSFSGYQSRVRSINLNLDHDHAITHRCVARLFATWYAAILIAVLYLTYSIHIFPC